MASSKLVLSIATALTLLVMLLRMFSTQPNVSLKQNFLPAQMATNADEESVTNGLEYVGSSYNFLIGNPLNSETQDPGIYKQIFDFSYAQKKRTPDDLWLIPDQVQAEIRQFCQFQSDYSSYTGIQSYQQQLKKSINFELSVFSPFGFSLGKEYVKNSIEFSLQRQVQWSIAGSCEAYSLTVDTYDLQPLRRDFVEGLRTSYESNDWNLFIQTYGTHFLNRAIVGGRMSVLQTMEQHAYANLESQQFNFEVGAKASYKKITGKGTYDSDTEKALGETFYKNSRHSTVYFLGAIPPADGNLGEWQASVRQNPTAISYDLLPLYELVTARDFPTLSKQQVKDSMLAGFQKYCTRNNCTQPSNDPPFPLPATATITKTPLYGSSTGGTYIADVEVTNPNLHVCRVRMQCGDDVDSVQLFLCDGHGNEVNLERIGGGGGKHTIDIPLPWNEFDYINGFTGTYHYSKKYPYLISLQFTTNTGRLIPDKPCSKHRGDNSFSGNTDGPLVGVYGYQGARIDRIGFYGSQFYYPSNEDEIVNQNTVIIETN